MHQYLSRKLWMVLCWSLAITPLVSADTLETPHFFIVYPPEDASLAQTLADSMERARETLTAELGVSHEDPLKIRLVSYVGGVGKARYLPDRRTIEVLTTEAMTRSFDGRRSPLRFIEGVLWHEYTHFLQHRAMKRFIKDRNALWFIEGTAEHLGTLRFIRPHSPEAVWREGETILSGGRLPTLEDLNCFHKTNQCPLTTYFFSADAVAFLVREWGMESLRQMNRGLGEGKGFSQCLSESLGVDLKTFEEQWHQRLENEYKPYIKNS